MLQDVIYCWRQWRRSPAFAVSSLVSLALGIGAAAAVFSVIYAALLHPFPYPDAGRMGYLPVTDKAGSETFVSFTGPQLLDLRRARCIEGAMGMDQWNLVTSDQDLPEDVTALYLTSDAGSVLGIPAMIGRFLIPSDAPESGGAQPIVVLSYKYWQHRYNGDRAIVGRSLQLDRKSYTIVGVMPASFRLFIADVYMPLEITANPAQGYEPMIKLRPGVTRAAASAELDPLLHQFAKQTPAHFPNAFRASVVDLNDVYTRRLGYTLSLLFAAVGLLLAIGCANVSILLLGRGAARKNELAIRSSIGASRRRIVRQLLTESITLSAVGAALGILLAWKLPPLIVRWLPEFSIPAEVTIGMNWPVVLFSAGLAIVTGIAFGIAPALQLSRLDLAQAMQASGRRMAGGGRGRLHTALVAVQVALTLLLLTATGSAMRAFMDMVHTNLGCDPHNTMTVTIPIHPNTHRAWQDRVQYLAEIRKKIAETPEVVDATVTPNGIPPVVGSDVRFYTADRPGEERHARATSVGPDFFNVLRIPLLRGRVWDQAENMRAAPLAVVSRRFARETWPNGDAIGRKIRLPQFVAGTPSAVVAPGVTGWFEIVGIVGDIRNDGFRREDQPAVYIPYTMRVGMYTQIIVRTRVAPLPLLRSIREQVRSVNPDQQVMVRNSRPLETWIAEAPERAQERMVTVLFTALSIVALVLSAFGLYSVVAYFVAQRTNEIGVRMALGASRADVVRLVTLRTGASVGLGVVVGIAISLAFSSLIAKWTSAPARDPLVLASVVLILSAAAALACIIPARRASSVDPATALRYD